MGTIAEKLTYLEGTKSAIKDAIIAKGVEVTDTDTFRSYAEKIESIEAGGSCESQSKEINITDNGTRVVTPDEGYLLDQVTVTTNVTTGKPELPNGISFNGSTWTTFDTDPYDWSQVYSGTNMFDSCQQLQTLTGTGIENVYFLDLYSTFCNCRSLTTIPKLQGKPTTLSDCFNNCQVLQQPDLTGLDFSDVASIYSAFKGCPSWVEDIDLSLADIRRADYAYADSKITKLPKINYSKLELCIYMFQYSQLTGDISIDLHNAIKTTYMFHSTDITSISITGMMFTTDCSYMFYYCSNLHTVSGFQCASITNFANVFKNCTSLQNIDGLFNLGAAFTSDMTVYLLESPLTRESCLNIFNTVYDFIGNGSPRRGTLRLMQPVIDSLTEEDIAIATAKGWTIQ